MLSTIVCCQPWCAVEAVMQNTYKAIFRPGEQDFTIYDRSDVLPALLCFVAENFILVSAKPGTSAVGGKVLASTARTLRACKSQK